jgi:2,4-dienoyl-CoA reductase-like NADH-dependent reductase (Old Yellow Enzyme family)
MEATAVSPEGRITPGCLGLWKDAHIPMLSRIAAFSKSQGAVIGIQLAHAGRKASMDLPWRGGKRLDSAHSGWTPVAPSAISFNPEHAPPQALSLEDIARVKADFVAAARRAAEAGFQLIEIHGAHGYLLHEFLSPLSNKRADAYGGTPENRRRLIVEVAKEMRAAVPATMVIGARLSCVDWAPGGLEIADTVETAKALKAAGLDFIDCSSGALTPDAKIPVAPGYQVPFAKRVRAEAGIPTMAVGLIISPDQADDIVKNGEADIVLLAREMLRDPYFPVRAAAALGLKITPPPQYERGW